MAPPWGTYDLPGGHTTTYGGSFMPWTVAIPVRGVKPKEQHPWKVEARFTSRSTAQESYQLTAGGGPQPSCKPVRAYQPTDNLQAMTTTSGAHYVPHLNHHKVAPIVPKRKEVDGSKFDTRSTAQESYGDWSTNGTYVPRKPIYPALRVQTPTPFECTSTSRASYVALPYIPYVPAKKPPAAMQEGAMA